MAFNPYTPVPQSPLVGLGQLAALIYGIRQKQAREAQQGATEAERQAALRREEALRMQELERQDAARKAELWQWAQTPEGYKFLQDPANQELFRQMGGNLEILSQQTVMPQGIPVPTPGSAPISAVSAIQAQNQYRLPEKPDELLTVAEYAQKYGLPMTPDAERYAKVPWGRAKELKLVNFEEPQPVVMASDYFPSAPQGMTYEQFAKLPADVQKQYATTPAGPAKTYRDWGLTGVVDERFLDWPAPVGDSGLPVVPDYIKAEKAPSEDPEKLFRNATEDMDSLANSLASAIGAGDEAAAKQYYGRLVGKMKLYQKQFPDVDWNALYPGVADAKALDSIKGEIARVKEEKARAKLSTDAGDTIKRLKDEIALKVSKKGIESLTPGDRFIWGAEESDMQAVVRMAQNDAKVKWLAMEAAANPAKEAEYQKALDTAIKAYSTRMGIQQPQLGVLEPLPEPPADPFKGTLFEGTALNPTDPAQAQKRTDAYKKYKQKLIDALDRRTKTPQEIRAAIIQDANEGILRKAELDSLNRELARRKIKPIAPNEIKYKWK